MVTEYKQIFSVRVKEEIREKIKYIAKQNSRSMNGQIEFVLEKHIAEYEKRHGKIKTE